MSRETLNLQKLVSVLFGFSRRVPLFAERGQPNVTEIIGRRRLRVPWGYMCLWPTTPMLSTMHYLERL